VEGDRGEDEVEGMTTHGSGEGEIGEGGWDLTNERGERRPGWSGKRLGKNLQNLELSSRIPNLSSHLLSKTLLLNSLLMGELHGG